MREVVRRSPGMPQDVRQIENCYLNNLDAPVVRAVFRRRPSSQTSWLC